MVGEEYKYFLKVGNSRRKVEPLNMVLGKPHCRGDENDWVIDCSVSGFYMESKEVGGRSAFDCFICGTAYLRQTLRFVKAKNPKLKLFFEVDGGLDELAIDDIFMTHDCVTEEIEEIIEWAKDNGFKAKK